MKNIKYRVWLGAVCDNQMKIRFVDATHQGASNDSLIWRMSELRKNMEEKYLQDRSSCWLLRVLYVFNIIRSFPKLTW